jgi:hypothetical protein
MKYKLQELFEFISIGNSSIYEGDNLGHEILKIFGTSFNFAFYFFNKKLAIEDTKKSFLNSNFHLSRKVWNLLDGAVIKSGFQGALGTICNIKYRKKLFLKKTENIITMEVLMDIDNKIKSGFIQNQNYSGFEYENTNDNLSSNLDKEKKLYIYKRNKDFNDGILKFLQFFYFIIKFL